MGRRPHLVLAALALSAAARAADPAPFSHERHLEFVSRLDPPPAGDARCVACHERGGNDAPAAVRETSCTVCHQQFVPQYVVRTPLPPRETKSRLAVPFSHARHAVSGRVTCSDCHGPAAAPGASEGRVRAFTVERECAGCHARTQVDRRACAACHGVDAKLDLPPDHRGAWLRSGHPGAAAASEGRHGRECGACHGADACSRCHRQREPQDHTSLFKVRLHGTAASWDRERCSACHEAGVCVRCHSTTAPLNHTGAWLPVHMFAAGAVGNESCAACHHRSFCDRCHGGP